MRLEIRSIHEKLPSVLLASIFAVFVGTFLPLLMAKISPGNTNQAL